MTAAVSEPVWTEPALGGALPAWPPPARSLLGTEMRSFFQLKRSPLSIKEKKKEKNRGKGYSEMRVFLPPPWSQTQVWTRRARGSSASGAGGLAGGRSSAAPPPALPSPSPLRHVPAVGARSVSGSSLPRVLLSLSCCSQWCFSFSSGKQVSIYFYFLLPRIRC